MELIQYWRTIRRFAWVIVLFTLIAGITSAVVTQELPRTYQATTVALVNPTQVVLPSNGQNVLPVDQLVQTYVELINTGPVRARLAAAGLPRDKGTLAGEIAAKNGGNTTLINITITDHDPNVALQAAQNIIPAFNQSLDELQSRVNVNAQSPRLEALVAWEVPDSPPAAPVSPKPILNIGFATIAGLLAGLGLAFLLEYLDNTVKRDYDVQLRLGLPLLGLVVYRKSARRGAGVDPVALVTHRHSQDPMAEAYRAIRTNVNFSVQDRQLRNLLVTSSIPGEGKTSTATNLAVVMAQAGSRVILVDADFRRPNMHKMFGKLQNIGLGNLIMGDKPEEELIQATQIPNLSVVCSGPTPPNPSELLGSRAMDRVIKRLAELADVVIYDTPPLGAVTDATVLAGRCDGVILVVERGKTAVPAIIRSKETLQAVRAPILGVVLNKVRGSEAQTYYYYYYQYQGVPTNGKAPKNGKNGKNGKAAGRDAKAQPAPRLTETLATARSATPIQPRSGTGTGTVTPPSGLPETAAPPTGFAQTASPSAPPPAAPTPESRPEAAVPPPPVPPAPVVERPAEPSAPAQPGLFGRIAPRVEPLEPHDPPAETEP